MFFGEKLQNVRELNGLSRKELADKLNVSEQAIWQYENLYTVPKFEIANEMKKLFNVKAQFFYTEPFAKNISKAESIAYRSEDREARKKAKMETTYLDFISYFLDKFENKLNLPVSTIKQLREEFIQILNLSNNENNETTQLEILSENTRKKLDIQSNEELLYKLELSGIYIWEPALMLIVLGQTRKNLSLF